MPANQAQPISHTMDHAVIDRLVRKVIRRLAEINQDKTSSTKTETTQLREKVITAAMIENIPDTQKHLSIESGAIITPAARDEAQRRKISIERTTTTLTQLPPSETTGQPTVICDRAEPQRAASITAQLLRRGVTLPKTNVLLSETPGRDVYEQCDKYGQRAVMVTSLADVDRFAAELSPTCWVLDMTRLNFVAATNVAARIAQVGCTNT